MTSPYHAEMAKRGYVLPRKEPCPRTRRAQVVPRLTFTPRALDRRARNAEWRKLYTVDEWTLTDIATHAKVSAECVRGALRTMGVEMRKQGGGKTMAALMAENKRLTRENFALRGRLTYYRNRMCRHEEAA